MHKTITILPQESKKKIKDINKNNRELSPINNGKKDAIASWGIYQKN